MNHQAEQLIRWLLAGSGAIRNVAQLLADSFGSAAVAAVTVGPTVITAHPFDPAVSPDGDYWTAGRDGWTHPLQSRLLPPGTSARHNVVAGITSRNELLVIDVLAADYLGIDGGSGLPLLRSWLLQLLANTPEAHVGATDAGLGIAGLPRLTVVSDAAGLPGETTVLLTSEQTSGPSGEYATVSTRADFADNVLLCDGPVSGVHLAGRYWPLWRRLEIDDQQWRDVASTLMSPAHTPPAHYEPTPEPEAMPPVPAPPVAAHPVEQRSGAAENRPTMAPRDAPILPIGG